MFSDEFSDTDKIILALLKGEKSTPEIGIYLGHDEYNIKYNLFSRKLNELNKNGFIKSEKGKKGNNTGIKGPPPTYHSLIFTKDVLRNIFNKHPKLIPYLQQNQNVCDLIFDSNPNIYTVGIKEEDEYGSYLESIPKKELDEIKASFISYIQCSQEMFEICLFSDDEKELISAFKDILSLVDKRDLYDPEFETSDIYKYTENGYLACDVVFESCLFVDMLKGNDYKAGLKYLKKKKNRITNSEYEALIDSIIERQTKEKLKLPKIFPKANNIAEKNEK